MRDALSKGCEVSSPYELNSSLLADSPQKALITLGKPSQHLWSQWQHCPSNSSKKLCWLLHCRKTNCFVPLRFFEHRSPGLQHLTHLPSSFFTSFLLLLPSKLSYNFIFLIEKNPGSIINSTSNFAGMLYKQPCWDWSSNRSLEIRVSTSSYLNSFSSMQYWKHSCMEASRKKGLDLMSRKVQN